MGQLDFNKPYEFKAIVIENVPTTHGVSVKVIAFRIAIDWSEVVSVQQFVRKWLVPEEERELTVITTKREVITVIADFDDVIETWTAYKVSSTQSTLLIKN